MELAGKVIAVLEPRGGVSKTGNEWKVQEYVIETHDQYPKKMCFDVFGADKIAQFNIQAGEELNVFFDVDAREWNGRWLSLITHLRAHETKANLVCRLLLEKKKKKNTRTQTNNNKYIYKKNNKKRQCIRVL